MGRRLNKDDDMEIIQLHEDLKSLKKQMHEVLLILGGSASYDFKGMRSDVRDLKADVTNIKTEIEQIKRERAFLSFKKESIPTKIFVTVTFLGMILTIVQSVRSLWL